VCRCAVVLQMERSDGCCGGKEQQNAWKLKKQWKIAMAASRK